MVNIFNMKCDIKHSNMVHLISVPCQTVYNGVCFVVVPLAMAWSDAHDNCVILGGRLAEVTDEKINEDLKAFVNGIIIVIRRTI